MEKAGRRLENMLPVVRTLVQIAHARQSFAETANINRLTVLALVFVPQSLVASLFGMEADIMPGKKHFWSYFAVAMALRAIADTAVRALVGAAKGPLHQQAMYESQCVFRVSTNKWLPTLSASFDDLTTPAF